MNSISLEQLEVSRVLHAGYVFSSGDTKIIFDPLFENPFSQNCYAYPSVTFDIEALRQIHFSAVFISHFHDDHCSFESLNLLDRKTPIYIYCVHQELIDLILELGFIKVITLKIDEPVTIGPFKITARRALDADVDSIFQIQHDEINILNVVDSWIDDDTMRQLLDQSPWDLILWPFQPLRELEVLSPSRASNIAEIPHEWIDQLQRLRPRYLIPSSCQFIHESWSWYNTSLFPISYSYFKEEVQKSLPDVQIFRLNPGQTIRFNEKAIERTENLHWVIANGLEDVDYQYAPEKVRPSTAQIADFFPKLSDDEMNFVIKFCCENLLKKFEELDEPESKYFLKKFIWKLILHSPDSKEVSLYYSINKNQIELLQTATTQFAWLTEVPAFKIYSVLKNGESLSSMYLRINDVVFSKEQEIEISAVDILEDPLIRVLFTGNFASYQKAQLQKINDKFGLKP